MTSCIHFSIGHRPRKLATRILQITTVVTDLCQQQCSHTRIWCRIVLVHNLPADDYCLIGILLFHVVDHLIIECGRSCGLIILVLIPVAVPKQGTGSQDHTDYQCASVVFPPLFKFLEIVVFVILVFHYCITRYSKKLIIEFYCSISARSSNAICCCSRDSLSDFTLATPALISSSPSMTA